MASRKQLFELLEEKQEPFLLRTYLLEHGCSTKRLQRLSSQRFRRKMAAFNFLRSILTKFVHGQPFSKALSWDNKTTEGGRLSSVLSCFSGISSRDLGGDHQWRCMEVERSKQLSPVSVHGFPGHRSEEENESTMSSFDSPRQMPEASNSSHCSKNQEEKLMMDGVREAGAKLHYKHGHLSPDIREKSINEKVLSWQRIQGDMSSLLKLLGSDISELRNEWSQFRAEVSVVGVEMEASIFEEIVDETVLEILGIYCI